MKLLKTVFIGLLLVFLFNSAVPAQNAGHKEIHIRVLTFNILHGATTKGDFDLDKIASVINEVKPDLVALQEVDYKTRRAKKYDLATELGWRTSMAPLFGPAMPYDGGWYGEAVLSKMPVIGSRNVPLPHSPGNEPRAALEITVALESGDTVCFIGTHLEHQRNSNDRVDQVRSINKSFRNNRYPTILAGDLNDTPDSEAIQLLKKEWTDASGNAATYSSKNPVKKIDYILYRPAQKWQVAETRVICDTLASDHCAVFSVLRLVK